jgi:hypothetical protein
MNGINRGANVSWTLAALVAAAVLLLHLQPTLQPFLRWDDFQILECATTWEATWANLWMPNNEHVMPLGRLTTWALLQAAGGQTRWARVLAWQGPLSLLWGLGLVYLLVRRELGHSFYGMVAVIVFGVSAVYHQAVSWFSASFSILAMDMLLLGLLAAQRWRQCGRWWSLGSCAAWCVLAPCWFATGVLAGPFCALYLLVPQPGTGPFWRPRAWLPAAVPLLGTGLFLAVSFPLAAREALHTQHFQGRSALEAFGVTEGIVRAGRSTADNLILGAFGISLGFRAFDGFNLTLGIELAILAGFAALLVWWWVPQTEYRLLGLGLGLIGLTYFVTYGARALWQYEGVMNRPFGSRYHLLPQLGLALLVSGGLPGRADRWFRLDPRGILSARQTRTLTALVGLLVLLHGPHAMLGMHTPQPEIETMMQRVEEVDELCRQHQIRAATARQVLGKYPVPEAYDWNDGWLLLRGSPTPRDVSVEEARRLLGAFIDSRADDGSPSAPR